jgi:hypothetical protein
VSPTNISMRMPAWLEQAWLTRYLDRQLSGDESAWFEAYVLDKAELLQMIDADTMVRDAITDYPLDGHRNVSPSSATVAIKPKTGPNITNDISALADSSRVLHRRVQPSWIAIAATLFLGLGIGSVGMRSLVPSQGVLVMASPTRVIYDTMRGGATLPRIEHPDSKSPYLLIEVAVPPTANQIALKIDGTKDQALIPSPDGFVTFLLKRDASLKRNSVALTYVTGDTVHQLKLDATEEYSK